jgi:hypothetical protein
MVCYDGHQTSSQSTSVLARKGELDCAALEDTQVITVYFGGGATNLHLHYEPLMTLVC